MSDTSQGEGWWIASDNKWYPPEQHPDFVAPSAGAPVKPSSPPPSFAAETVAIPAAGSGTPVSSPNPGPNFVPPGAETQTYAPDATSDPTYNLGTPDDSSSSKRGLILGIGALVLIAGLGFLGFRLLNGASAAGGADSPEAAIDQLITSVNERDAVGFVDVFDPDEIEAWVGSFAPAIAKFDEIDARGEASNEFSDVYESIFDSFDYTLTGPGGDAVMYDVEPLDDNGRISRVRVEGLDFELVLGEADSSIIIGIDDDPTAIDLREIDGARLELRDERGGLAARLLVPGEPAEDEFAPDAHLDLVTVQKDGKWFVSMGYSFLEIARNQGEFDGFPRPDFGRAFALVDDQTGGAESPEQVVQTMFTAIENLDYETIIEITDPLGTPYLHDYQTLIDSEVDDAERRDAAREANLRFDELELGVSEWEGRTLVTTNDISGSGQDIDFAIDTTTWCITVEDDFDRERICLEDGVAELLFEVGSDLDPRDFIPDETGFIVVERNGRWYIDPLGTMGFYVDQIAEVASIITDELEGNTATELGDFFVVEGPIARRDMPASTQGQSGSAGVAVDLSDYPVIDADFSEFHVAVARVVTDQPGSFVSFDDVALTGEDWLVVYEQTDPDISTPAIAVTTDGTLDVELFEVQVSEVGSDGFSGQLGGQGRPQIFTFSDDLFNADISIDGASADTVFGWETNGVVLNRPDDRFIIGDGAFTVIYGEPGAPFTINVDVFEPEPEPTPTPPPTPAPVPTPTPDLPDGLGDATADAFAGLVEPEGYSYEEPQIGGFFDGCGGPDDPDVVSYVFQGNGNMVVTPYPSAARAQAAFDQLVNVVTPCEVFGDIEIVNIDAIDSANTRIEWQNIDGSGLLVYEHYRLSGDTIVVATNTVLADLELQLAILDFW